MLGDHPRQVPYPKDAEKGDTFTYVCRLSGCDWITAEFDGRNWRTKK